MKLVPETRIIVSFLFLVGIITTLSADGYLTVRTEPEGIEVWLDDNFVGDSPIIDRKLKAGRYSLKLVDPVQRSSTVEDIFIQDNENTVIEKTITSKFGTLRVTSVPEGALVSIATELGPTPVANDFMNPGKYRLEIRHPDKKFHPIIEEIVIPRGESVSLSKTLEQEEVEGWTNKDTWRIILGLGTAGGYVFGIIQYGSFKRLQQQAILDPREYPNAAKERPGALAAGILGIIGGSLCLVGLEILAFF
jgi:hypothetical protein